MNEYIVPLAEINKADRLVVGGKAANLGELMRSGIQVPEGYAVTTAAYDYFLTHSSLPNGLLSDLMGVQNELGGKIALRSSATVEDETGVSMAGVFKTHYLNSESELEQAVSDIYSNARSPEVLAVAALHHINPEDIKMGLVAQRLIEPDFAGVAFTGVNQDQVLVQYVSGFGASLVDGTKLGTSVLADRSGEVQSAPRVMTEPLAQSITKLVVTSVLLENLFGGQRQDIEFVIQQNQVYIVQARALTRELGRVTIEETAEDTLENIKFRLKILAESEKAKLGTPHAIFYDSNLGELLPHSTEMDVGIFQYLFTGSDGVPGAMQLGRREMGYPLKDDSIGLMEYIGGRPYASTARHAGMFYAGFPGNSQEYYQTLVTEYLNAIQQDPNKGRYPEMSLFLQDPTLDDLVSRYGERGHQYYETYLSFAQGIARQAEESPLRNLGDEEAQILRYGDFSVESEIDLEQSSEQELVSYVIQKLENLRTGSCIDFVKVARLGFYYAQKLQGELLKLYSPDEARQKFGKLSSVLLDTKITTTNLQIATLPPEDAYQYALTYLGHFSAGEVLEIRHPRFKDDPEALKAYVDGLRSSNYMQNSAQRLAERQAVEEEIVSKLPESQRAEFKILVQNAQIYMSGRETVKYHFTRGYAVVRDVLEALQTKLGLSKGDIYYIYPRELAQLVQDPSKFQPVIASRKKAFQNYSKLDLPSVIREQDIDGLPLKADDQTEFIEDIGIFLSEGPKTQGEVVNLDLFDNPQAAMARMVEIKNSGQKVILVAKQINIGSDPLIAQADFLLIENANIASHGAQRARELGKGALGGIKSNQLKNGMILDFDPVSRIVKRIES